MVKMAGGNIVTEKITDKVRMLASFDLPKGEKGEAKITFTLSRDGNLVDGPYILETTNLTLNPFVLRTIKSASPFSPFPEALKEDKQNFKIILSYETNKHLISEIFRL